MPVGSIPVSKVAACKRFQFFSDKSRGKVGKDGGYLISIHFLIRKVFFITI